VHFVSDFESVLESIEKDITKAQFITIDTEFTGLKDGNGRKYNFFDTLKEYYAASRERTATFLAVQYGLCLFFYDAKTKS